VQAGKQQQQQQLMVPPQAVLQNLLQQLPVHDLQQVIQLSSNAWQVVLEGAAAAGADLQILQSLVWGQQKQQQQQQQQLQGEVSMQHGQQQQQQQQHEVSRLSAKVLTLSTDGKQLKAKVG
jgi:hypothetical protein